MALRSIALVCLVVACGKSGTESEKKPPPPPVKLPIAKVVLADTPKQIPLSGVVQAKERAEVTADTQGKVLAVKVQRGDRVKQGDPVVQLDVQSAALAAREAQANVASARTQRQLAEEECKRTKQLFEKGAITKSEYDRQIAACTTALEQVQAAEARAGMMAKSVVDGQVRAPFTGLVAEKSVSPGEWVAPGKPLFTLVDDDPLHVDLSVPEAAVAALHDNQDVDLVSVALPGKHIHAVIKRVGVEIGKSRALIAEAVIDKDSGLKPGMFVEAHVTIDPHFQRPIVPNNAVVRINKQWHVFVVGKDGELEDRVIHIGPAADAKTVAIENGLTAGDDKAKVPAERVVGDVCEKGCACGFGAPTPLPPDCKMNPAIIDGLRVVE
jgi:membrane fusion protein (multidrug efflux system)